MSLKIKFAEDFPKLWGQKKAKLLAVEMKHGSELPEDLVEYDTIDKNGEYYPLPKGLVIVLTFTGDKMIPFPTIRKYVSTKFEMYQRNIGQLFDIVIEAEKPEDKPNVEQTSIDLKTGEQNDNGEPNN